MGTKKTNAVEAIAIKAPNIQFGKVYIKGNAPLVIHKFSHKTAMQMMDAQVAGSTSKTKKNREAMDPDANMNAARHISFEGWDGIPAVAFRAACISACRLVGYKMTMAKLSIFIDQDGFDSTEGTPLVRICGPAPRRLDAIVRVGPKKIACVCSRPQWLEWGACLRFKYDADQFTASDIVNLIARAGTQVGVCEGRPDSSNSVGMGWGTFEISTEEEIRKLEEKAGKESVK